jgi:hypothetical protein
LASVLEIDEAAFLKLLEIRILTVSIVSGFVLTSLSVVASQAKSYPGITVYLPYLARSYSLAETLVIHSGLTLVFLFVYALVDLAAMHCLAFNSVLWSVRAYKANLIFAPVPFVYGAAVVFGSCSFRDDCDSHIKLPDSISEQSVLIARTSFKLPSAF